MDLEAAKKRAEQLLARADMDVEAAVEELRDCGIDPDKPLEPQLAELDAEAIASMELAHRLQEELSAVLEGD